jgi:hypothetical protein
MGQRGLYSFLCGTYSWGRERAREKSLLRGKRPSALALTIPLVTLAAYTYNILIQGNAPLAQGATDGKYSGTNGDAGQ